MAAIDGLLTSTLGLYREVQDAALTEQLYHDTTTLLANLFDPRNITLLTTHFLTEPAVWARPPEPGSDPADGLIPSYRVLSVFNGAARHVRRRNEQGVQQIGGGSGGVLSNEAWARAVVKGTDDCPRRWQHLLVLAGALLGLYGGDGQPRTGSWLSGSSFSHILEEAVVTATNLALAEEKGQAHADASVLLALNYAYPLLSAQARHRLNNDLLLGVGVRTLTGPIAFDNGAWIGATRNERAIPPIQQAQQRLLLQGMGPLSKLIASAVEHARDPGTVIRALDDLEAFSERVFREWWASAFAETEAEDEAVSLTPETVQVTWPALWDLLRKLLYAMSAILHSILTRSLVDGRLGSYDVTPRIASKVLFILRHVYFISCRPGFGAFQAYDFIYLTAMDMLARSPDACVLFLQTTVAQRPAASPIGRRDRIVDLFYFNTAEHLALALPPVACDELIITPAKVYLSLHPLYFKPQFTEVFEAAHSAVLAVMSCPHNAALTAALAPFYARTLFASFPSRISPRQFRLAFRAMMQILSPPFPASASHPDLAETLLEMVRFQVQSASAHALPPAGSSGGSSAIGTSESERSTLVLTLIDALPFLPLPILEEWLRLTAESLHLIVNPAERAMARQRFQDVLTSGEMDVERAPVALEWWGSKGGRQLVLYGGSALMSGALQGNDGTIRL